MNRYRYGFYVSHVYSFSFPNSKNQRVWDKIHFCYYCDSSFTNISKHYLGPHRNELEVKMILNHPKKSKERTLDLLKLRNAGDFKNNMAVFYNFRFTNPDFEYCWIWNCKKRKLWKYGIIYGFAICKYIPIICWISDMTFWDIFVSPYS